LNCSPDFHVVLVDVFPQCAGVDKGAAKPGTEVVGTVHVKQIYEIAKVRFFIM